MQLLVDKGVVLFASPYSCWEILCHLDEPNNFSRIRTILLKFQYVTILDSPSAEIENAIVGPNNDRITEVEYVQASLAALQHSNSLETFYSAFIRLSNSRYSEIADVFTRARDILNRLEIEYSQFATKVITHFRTLRTVEDITNHQNYILNFVLGEFNKLKERYPRVQFSENEVIRRFYV
jgi:hypothetical protein